MASDCEDFQCENLDELDLDNVPGLEPWPKRKRSESFSSQSSLCEVMQGFPLNPDGTTPEGILGITSSLGKHHADDEEDPDPRSPKKPRAASLEGSTSTIAPSERSNSIFSASTIVEIAKEKPYIICPPPLIQDLLVCKNIPYGVQYELSRLVNNGELQYADLDMSKLEELADKTNADAVPKLPEILGRPSRKRDSKFAKEEAAKSPWAEFDRENLVLKEWPTDGCLGFRYPGWHGGKVLLRGILQHIKTNRRRSIAKPAQYMIQLERAELGPSTRFSRRFGSRSFFRLKVSKEVLRDVDFDTFFQRPVILCGDVFRAFYAKDTNAFYFRTNETYNEKTGISPGISSPVSFSIVDFLEWHNPIEHNKNQTLAKYASRFSLGLSNSAPGLSLDSSQVIDIEDVISSSESRSDMTDGAGLINDAALLALHNNFHWPVYPTAIQIRFAGSKGMVSRHHSDRDKEPRIYLRNSQKKIQYPTTPSIDTAKSSIDVLRASNTHATCRLSVETIVNLAENGVPSSVFIDLLKQNGKALLTAFTKWDIPDAMVELYKVVGREGRVMAARRARENIANARVLGYSNRSPEEDSDDEDGLPQDTFSERSSAWWPDEISGSPSTLEETVLNLLASGFTPSKCPILAAKLREVIKSQLLSHIRHLRIDVEMAATAFLIPDPLNILEPGEIFFKSSNRILTTPDGIKSDVVVGDVLLGRNPTKLPGDVQKWKAVFRPELFHLTDVIVLSVKGDRRAADFLAGGPFPFLFWEIYITCWIGDYDGDKGYLIWHPSLVSPFTNPPAKDSQEPENMKERYFAQGIERVSTFLELTKDCTKEEKYRRLLPHLLGALRDTTLVGKYSNYHDCAVYTLGYKHKETIRLAHMFCMVLDASKSGLSVLPNVLRDDAEYNGSLNWKTRLKKKKDSNETFDKDANNHFFSRNLPPFVMDVLCAAAEKEYDELYSLVEKLFQNIETTGRMKVDEDLQRPWQEQLKLCTEQNPHRRRELDKIENHVKQVRQEWETQLRPQGPKHQRFTDLSIELRQDVLRDISRKFHSYPTPEDVGLSQADIQFARASYAYIHDRTQKNGGFTRFPWDVAFRHLCEIKARATETQMPVIDTFYSRAHFK
ncbi:hypothetical protein BDN72DRAFT_785862 [Pluteus cervinus]|uniref:Uncharacterized protein n=1 Tax=Pluteus cervinus TaxID=181527 RepID=A0ACD3BDN6_9AGAR|nr:hypothetical protein BDN72DRAFT_785862 [Pluteus cervinus]